MTMATAEAPNAVKSDIHYDPEDVGLRNSPRPQIHRPKLERTPSPPFDGVASEVSTPPGSPGSHKVQNIRSGRVANPGDAVLIGHLANFEAPEVVASAGEQLIRSASDDEEMGPNDGSRGVEMPVERESNELEALAAGALRAFNAGDGPPIKTEAEGPVDGQRHISSNISNINGNHELAPIQVSSPKANTSTNVTLPSISSQLGDLKHLADAATAVVDTVPSNGVHRQSISSQSPPQASIFRAVDSAHHQPAGHGHASPPISPRRRELPSPGLPSAQFYYSNPRRPSQVSDGIPYSATGDYGGNLAEVPGADHTGSPPNGIPAGINRMSIDGITNPPVGGFQCNYPGCSAQPFQTQYLLNSHANVHSSNRPHYCPVKGCQRSEGGKGFKRKNEMIRHGLVHESPGYVCPYCMDREHKYPRPDNLQRHVRVHHMDKDKDDPLLREVLAQRPEGPNRGRRRRGGNN